MDIHEVTAKETLALRQQVLRPEADIEQCNFDGDNDLTTHHLACIIDDDIVGIVSIYQCSNFAIHSGEGYQIRGMATGDALRGQGIGLKLLQAAESMAFSLGADYVWANARVSAIGFYEKAAYKITGKVFDIEDVGPHLLIHLPKP